MGHHDDDDRNGNGGDDDDKLGEFTVGKLHHSRSFTRIRRLVFIRHGEKLDEIENGKTPGLNEEGMTRADNLYRVFGGGPGSLFKPDVIYAMQQGKHEDNSNRPFLTVAPLARRLGMDPQPDERTPDKHTKSSAGVFDNTFRQKKRANLVDDIVERAKDDQFNGKTLLFCWEHKNIPYIVGELGLADHELHWGLDPESGADDRTNYTAIWSFTPHADGCTLQVFKQFEVEPGDPARNEAPRVVAPPDGDYSNVVWEREE